MAVFAWGGREGFRSVQRGIPYEQAATKTVNIFLFRVGIKTF